MPRIPNLLPILARGGDSNVLGIGSMGCGNGYLIKDVSVRIKINQKFFPVQRNFTAAFVLTVRIDTKFKFTVFAMDICKILPSTVYFTTVGP